MSPEEREICRKLRVVEHAEHGGSTRRTGWYFGVAPGVPCLCARVRISRPSSACLPEASEGLVLECSRPEVVEKGIRLRRTQPLGSKRIVCR